MKKLYLYFLISCICAGVWGCGKMGTESSNNSDNTDSTETSASTTPGIPKNTSSDILIDNTTSPAATQETPVVGNNPGDSPEDNAVPGNTTAATEEAEQKIIKADISVEKPYTDANRSVTFLGLKEYKKIKGETYTDTPGKGKKYLVLFLSVKNNSYEENYINYNYFKAKLDGKKIEHTFLLNDPKNYPTIFTHIQPSGSIAGFIAWEVPAGWKKLEIIYNGWKDTDNISLNGSFTPKDLSDPLIYNANDYLNNTQE